MAVMVRRALALTLVLGATIVPTAAQEWPARAIRVVIPIGAGSSTDIVPRIIFEQLSAQLGQSIVVENRPGAGGTIGAAAVAKAEPDGYTILVHSSAHTLAPAVLPNLPYDPVADFTAVTMLANVPNVLVIAPSKNIRTLKEFVAAAQAKPGSVNYASGGTGTPTHLNMERLRLIAGFEGQHIPFKSAPEALTEVMTGRVDVYFCPILPALPFIRDGKLIALAVSGMARSPVLPDVPTTLEAGFPNSDYNFWIGMFVPKKTARDIVDKLYRETVKALDAPVVKDKLAKLAVEPMTMDPDKFGAYVAAEVVAGAALAKAAGVAAK